jgi:hypothetical protein
MIGLYALAVALVPVTGAPRGEAFPDMRLRTEHESTRRGVNRAVLSAPCIATAWRGEALLGRFNVACAAGGSDTYLAFSRTSRFLVSEQSRVGLMIQEVLSPRRTVTLQALALLDPGDRFAIEVARGVVTRVDLRGRFGARKVIGRGPSVSVAIDPTGATYAIREGRGIGLYSAADDKRVAWLAVPGDGEIRFSASGNYLRLQDGRVLKLTR